MIFKPLGLEPKKNFLLFWGDTYDSVTICSTNMSHFGDCYGALKTMVWDEASPEGSFVATGVVAQDGEALEFKAGC